MGRRILHAGTAQLAGNLCRSRALQEIESGQMSQPAISPILSESRAQGSSSVVKGQAANELFFAVVGHVGSGTTRVATLLSEALKAGTLQGGPFQVEILKAREVIKKWAQEEGETLPGHSVDDIDHAQRLQDLGDAMRLRTQDHAAVARGLIDEIRRVRAKSQGVELKHGEPVVPDGARRAYVLDALRHPAEVQLLRTVYRNAFTLVGVVADQEVRKRRLTKKFKNAGDDHALAFMERDSKAKEEHGQRVSDAFHLADYFVDNTQDRLNEDKKPNEDWNVAERLSRLVKIITHQEIVRPSTAESAMHAAYGAQLRSACLSKQVGAALVDGAGNIVSTGTNEVPKAGGGVYGQGFDDESNDSRCAYRDEKYCSNTREQNEIIEELISSITELAEAAPKSSDLRQRLRASRIGSLVVRAISLLLELTRSGILSPIQKARLSSCTMMQSRLSLDVIGSRQAKEGAGCCFVHS